MAVERKLIREHKRKVLVREFLHRETERAGFGGAEIQRTPMGTRINLTAERPGFVIGRRGATIKKLTEDLMSKFHLDNPQIEVQESGNPSLNPQIMAAKLAEALERGWHFRRAGHSTLRRIMEGGAKGALIRLSGKVTGGRSRVEKFSAGRIKYTGDTAQTLMLHGYSVAKKKLGTIGVVVSIMDPAGRLPDEIIVHGPKTEAPAAEAAPAAPAPQAPAAPAAAKPAAKPAAPAAPAAATEEVAAAPAKRKSIPLTDLEGVGKVKADALKDAGFGDIESLGEASEEELANVVGPKLAKAIRDQAIALLGK